MTTFGTYLPETILDLAATIEVSKDGQSAVLDDDTVVGSNAAALAGRLWPMVYLKAHVGTRLRDIPWGLRDEEFSNLLCSHWNVSRKVRLPVGEKLDDGGIIAEIAGVRFKIPPDHQALVESTEFVVEVMVGALLRGLSPGYVVASSAKPFLQRGAILRLYARIDNPESAAAAWNRLLSFLESQSSAWQAKVCSVRELYPRNDAIVVYLPRSGWRYAKQCSEILQSTECLGVQTSPFVNSLSDGVACAFEPSDDRPAYRRLSFGQHRARICTEAVIAHGLDYTHSTYSDVAAALQSHLMAAGIDPQNPARNLSSPMIDVLGMG